MSEFIREVDEEYRQDQIRSILTRYRVLIGATLVLILVAVAGYEAYTYLSQQKADAAGARYLDASDLARTDAAGAVSALDGLAKDGPPGYRILARFRAAGLVGKTDAAAGAKAFDTLADDASLDPDLRDVAKLRAAMLVMDTADMTETHRRFDPLADSNGTFRNLAREMLAVAALKAGDDAAAAHELDTILADPAAAPDARQRATLYLALIRADKPTTSKP